jgi:hypothetical protein
MTAPVCDACGSALVDVGRLPGPNRAQSVLASNPPKVWAQCEGCGERTTVPASRRWELKAPTVKP